LKFALPSDQGSGRLNLREMTLQNNPNLPIASNDALTFKQVQLMRIRAKVLVSILDDRSHVTFVNSKDL